MNFRRSEYRDECTTISISNPFVFCEASSHALNSIGFPTVADNAMIGHGASRSRCYQITPSSACPIQ